MSDDSKPKGQATNDPKAQTIKSLQTFELGKVAANASLSRKLTDFMKTLSPEERNDFEPVLSGRTGPMDDDETPVVSVFLKPMQVTAGNLAKDVNVFLKPMQRVTEEGERNVEIYLKPMQVTTSELPRDVTVFLKPMQRIGTEVTIRMTPGGAEEGGD